MNIWFEQSMFKILPNCRKGMRNFHLNEAAAALWLGLILKIGLLDLKALFGCKEMSMNKSMATQRWFLLWSSSERSLRKSYQMTSYHQLLTIWSALFKKSVRYEARANSLKKECDYPSSKTAKLWCKHSAWSLAQSSYGYLTVDKFFWHIKYCV